MSNNDSNHQNDSSWQSYPTNPSDQGDVQDKNYHCLCFALYIDFALDLNYFPHKEKKNQRVSQWAADLFIGCSAYTNHQQMCYFLTQEIFQNRCIILSGAITLKYETCIFLLWECNLWVFAWFMTPIVSQSAITLLYPTFIIQKGTLWLCRSRLDYTGNW